MQVTCEVFIGIATKYCRLTFKDAFIVLQLQSAFEHRNRWIAFSYQKPEFPPSQGPLITDGRNSNEMYFSEISLWRMTLVFRKCWRYHYRIKWHGFQSSDHKNKQKKFSGSGTTPFYFLALMNLPSWTWSIFGPFFTISAELRDRTE